MHLCPNCDKQHWAYAQYVDISGFVFPIVLWYRHGDTDPFLAFYEFNGRRYSFKPPLFDGKILDLPSNDVYHIWDGSICPIVPECLEDLLAIMKSQVIGEEPMIDWSNLPTFGGPEPENTLGVWSWDPTRLLVGEGTNDLKIVPRKE